MRWRRHQREALDAIADSADTRHWVVLPPGAGKTLAGVGAAASWGRPVVAFAPNVAIVSQWRAAWTAMTGEPATSDRDLPTGFTALTYQSLAVFDGEADGDSQKARLHPNGLALVERLHDAGPLTLVTSDKHYSGGTHIQRGLLVTPRMPDAGMIRIDTNATLKLTTASEDALGGLSGGGSLDLGTVAVTCAEGLRPGDERRAAEVETHLGEGRVAGLGQDREEGPAAGPATEVRQVLGRLGEIERTQHRIAR